MKDNSTAFIISEYNPFHNGHAYHIAQTKIAGAKRVICIMSGNFVQRGEPALFRKHIRAESAIRNGADLVLELPVKYAVSNASRFASGAIEVMRKCNIDGFLSFGASAGREALQELSSIMLSVDFRQKLRVLTEQTGKSFPAAAEYLITSEAEHLAVHMKDPNNLLALEYLSNLTAEADFTVIERRPELMHDSTDPQGEFASAKYLRGLLSSGDRAKDYLSFVPDNLYELYEGERLSRPDRIKYETAVLSRLLLLEKNDYLRIDNVGGGIENRLYEAVRHERTLQSIYDRVKTKRYTHARIRQIFLSAALGIEKEDLHSGVSYIRVLAFNNTGRELLHEMRSTAACPVAVNLSDVTQSPVTARDAALEASADAFYDLCLPESFAPFETFRRKPVIIE